MQADAPCFWFGAQQDCARWVIMSIFAGVFVVMDLAAGLFLSMLGSGVGRSHISPHMKACGAASPRHARQDCMHFMAWVSTALLATF